MAESFFAYLFGIFTTPGLSSSSGNRLPHLQARGGKKQATPRGQWGVLMAAGLLRRLAAACFGASMRVGCLAASFSRRRAFAGLRSSSIGASGCRVGGCLAAPSLRHPCCRRVRAFAPARPHPWGRLAHRCPSRTGGLRLSMQPPLRHTAPLKSHGKNRGQVLVEEWLQEWF